MDIESKIFFDISEIESRLSMIKTIPFLYSFTGEHQKCLIENLIPGMYAIWEYYYVSVLNLYIFEINKLKIPQYKIDESLIKLDLQNNLSIDLEKVGNLNNGIMLKLRDELIGYYSNEFKELEIVIKTEHNVNFKVLNKMLNKLNIDVIDDVHLENGLNKVLKFRNAIAHGDTILVTVQDFNEISNIILNAVYKISEAVLDAYKNKQYLKGHFR